MDCSISSSIERDIEHSASTPLLNQTQISSSPRRRPITIFSGIFFSILFLSSVAFLIFNKSDPRLVSTNNNNGESQKSSPAVRLVPSLRGTPQGVSEKTFRQFSDVSVKNYPWTNTMLSWQRTSYHFQPDQNWMNDPNGPLFHMGWYHLFYQYNPDSAVWGNITWGHAVSKDLINWFHLPFAMVPDQWYDINGVWTGSATILPDGRIVMLYTGDTNDAVQVQNLAYPANHSDPLLLDWVKYPGNPVLVPPPGIGETDFRDPTTAWVGHDGKWRTAIGSKMNKTGITLVYSTTNFTSFELLDGVLHAVPGTGMWECVDFYPVSLNGENGLDTSANGPGIKHVLKASLDDDKHDYYAIGTYNPVEEKWIPDDPVMDVGIGLRLDYGKYYASKTFFDQNKKRRILWGWIGETDSEETDLMKGWASVQTIPRTVVFDYKTGSNVIQWPVVEVEKLRSNAYEFNNVELAPGSVVPLSIGSATQLDISATFEVEKSSLESVIEADVGYNCTASGGAANRGILGPFGILVLADQRRTEQTPVYFYIAKGTDGTSQTHFCSDESRSSTAPDVGKLIYGSKVPVLEGEKFSMRLLVDHSIVESFAQGGRTVITSRVYPTRAIDGSARVFLFNNATGVSVTASVKAWHMDSANIRTYPLEL